jgi:hypothetical protein
VLRAPLEVELERSRNHPRDTACNGRLELDPYPFDVDPLPVVLPARAVQLPANRPTHLQSWRNGAVPQTLHFTMCHAQA